MIYRRILLLIVHAKHSRAEADIQRKVLKFSGSEIVVVFQRVVTVIVKTTTVILLVRRSVSRNVAHQMGPSLVTPQILPFA